MNETELDDVLVTLDPIAQIDLDPSYEAGLHALFAELLSADRRAGSQDHPQGGPPLTRHGGGRRRPHRPENEVVARRRGIGGPRRRTLALAAAAVVLAGAAGVILTVQDRDAGDETVATAPPADDLVAALAASDSSAGHFQWYLPSVTPPGYELVDIQAAVFPQADPSASDEPAPPVVMTQQWELSEGDRTIALVTAMAWPGDPMVAGYVPTGIPPEAADALAAQTENGTVHGVDATVTIGDMATVMWVEAGSSYLVQGVGALTSDDLLAIADASTVGVDGIDLGGAAIDGGVLEGYSLASSFDSSNPIGDQFVRVTFEATDAVSGRVTVEVAPADAYSAEPADEMLVVNDVEYRVTVWPPVGDIGERRTVSAVIGDRMVLANGPLPADQLVDVAANMRPATAPEAALAARQVSLRSAGLPLRGSATFTDGTAVSVRTAPNGSFVLCVHQPVVQCRWDAPPELITEVDEEAVTSVRYEVFTVGGERRAIGWYDGPSEVVVEVNEMHDVIPASTGSGQFVSVELADSEPPPTLLFPDDPTIMAAGGTVIVGGGDVIRP